MLEVNDLTVNFKMRDKEVTAIDNVSFSMQPGERLGVVGESGAGKSLTGFSILNMVPRPGYISSGEVMFEGQDLSKMDDKAMRSIRGSKVGMIFQDPMMTLNPVFTIGYQLSESLRVHTDLSKPEIRDRVLEVLEKVHMPSPEKRLEQYPHELSGGMRQRIVIASALLMNPKLIIADEPTTALDVTIQAEIMELMLELCESEGTSLMLITHDLGVVSEMTDRTMVMYAGKVIEMRKTRQLLDDPYHPYTKGLLEALPHRAHGARRLSQIKGSMPSLFRIPSGCAFSDRCERVFDKCSARPELKSVSGEDQSFDSGEQSSEQALVSCHLY